MGTIREEIEIIGTRKSKRISALFDSGAYRNYIRKEFEDIFVTYGPNGEKLCRSLQSMGYNVEHKTSKELLSKEENS